MNDEANNLVDIIIVCWNVGEMISDCVNSALKNKSVGSIILIDNASHDETPVIIRSLQSQNSRIVTIFNSKNLGFAAACNQGSLFSRNKYMLLLNPDVIVKADTIDQAVALMESNKFDVLSVKMVNEMGETHRSCARFPRLRNILFESLGLNRLNPLCFPGYLMTEWDHNSSKYVDHVIGAFYLTKTSLFKRVSGMDEKFFVYYEDMDLSKRIKEAGGVIYYSADIECFHEGGGSSKSIKAIRTFYAMQSRLHYIIKHMGIFKGRVYYMFLTTLEKSSRYLYYLLRGDWSSLREARAAYKMLSCAMDGRRS